MLKWMCLVYLRYWTLNLRPLMVCPKVTNSLMMDSLQALQL